MKERNHSRKTRETLLLIVCLCCLVVYLPSPSWGAESHRNSNRIYHVKESSIENVQISKIDENILIIDEAHYIITNKTRFYREDHDFTQPITLNEIIPPCMATITYKSGSQYTEAFPYHPGQRVLTSVVIQEDVSGVPSSKY
ncbi:MAG: hypothetical protein SVW57_08745 [Thermodesulfobacteriota bacterium]|nr:hypothetical protein [Thermodesulfobacteriota bacterium]